jgi:hypothetical protein
MPLRRPLKLCKLIEQIKIHSSYNLAAMSFTTEIAAEIRQAIRVRLRIEPDFRQKMLTAGQPALMTVAPEPIGMETSI